MECSETAEEAETRSCAAGLKSVFILLNGDIIFPLEDRDQSSTPLWWTAQTQHLSVVGFGHVQVQRVLRCGDSTQSPAGVPCDK